MNRHDLLLVPALAALALTVLFQGPVRARDPDYPSQELLRQLQLDTIACGRDNLAPDCDQARSTADPLLDHPRLSGNCKDALWQISQDAVVVPRNDFQRRERLIGEATDMIRFCRQLSQPLRTTSPPSRPQAPGRGFGLVPGS
ncbi:hypothetical protein IQ216_05540 [Cyanobium sp. LEGE 06143]|jgi:hypothetical protein|uniref:hypothetical protein n=1 Tax=unclassified Cyanobium TaxID=2627006 RepID=UPI001647C75F|nr:MULTISPECIES: hypothetical protein [unclassified Cyanobium]MBE9172567.1 hypothetical protein [Cyanobium sp. LEGE 06143]QNI69645.1 hypothetical protein CyaNS01_00492 [Cyanobium sp. NS01]